MNEKKDTYHVQMMMIKRVRFQLKIEKEIKKKPQECKA